VKVKFDRWFAVTLDHLTEVVGIRQLHDQVMYALLGGVFWDSFSAGAINPRLVLLDVMGHLRILYQ
jgi:hypothetical protein